MTKVITGIPPPDPFLQSPGEPNIPWTNWVKTFDNYITAIGLDPAKADARCRSILISCLGTEGQRIFYTFESSMTDTLTSAKTELSSYFVRKSSKWAERVKFYRRTQKPSESVEHFTSDLRLLASKCNFTAVADPVQEALLSQFISGISSSRVREKLILADDSTLTFSDAVRIAKEAEQARVDAELIQMAGRTNFPTNSAHLTEVNAVHQKHKSSNRQFPHVKQLCYRCGDTSHIASFSQCPAIGKKCKTVQKLNTFLKSAEVEVYMTKEILSVNILLLV